MPRVRFILVAFVLVAVLLVAIAIRTRAHGLEAEIMRADPESILDRPDLARVALAGGHAGFVKHCASCHGTGVGNATRGIPDLTDGDFLYGEGKVAEIEQIVLHGIRSGDRRGWHLASMPAYATPRPYADEPIPPMTPAQIDDVTEFLMAKHGRSTDPAAASCGETLFHHDGGCYDCHGGDGGGDAAIGAPNLLDDIWLYGDGSRRAIEQTLKHGRAGFSPAFAQILSAGEAREIAVYVASLPRHLSKDTSRD